MQEPLPPRSLNLKLGEGQSGGFGCPKKTWKLHTRVRNTIRVGHLIGGTVYEGIVLNLVLNLMWSTMVFLGGFGSFEPNWNVFLKKDLNLSF